MTGYCLDWNGTEDLYSFLLYVHLYLHLCLHLHFNLPYCGRSAGEVMGSVRGPAGVVLRGECAC